MIQNSVGVVIPFYQRQSGILQNSILSIINQSVSDTLFTIIIIDDESPISAESEVESINIPEYCHLKIIKQQNSGPAAARNKALDYLKSKKIPIVAFLDSDDKWSPNHIKKALASLNQGVDFYFCDHTRFDSDKTWFQIMGVYDNWENDLQELDISLQDNIATLSGENCFKLFLNKYLSQTSTVVYRFKNYSDIRFDRSFLTSGEDFLMWLELAGKSNKVAFSLAQEVHCDEGVNIYFDSFDWSKRAASSQQGYEYLKYIKILSSFRLDWQQQRYVNTMISTFKYKYSYLMFKHFLQGKGIDLKVFRKVFRATPLIACIIPFLFTSCLVNKKLLR